MRPLLLAAAGGAASAARGGAPAGAAAAGPAWRGGANTSELVRALSRSRWPSVLRRGRTRRAAVPGRAFAESRHRIPRVLLQTLNRKTNIPGPIDTALRKWRHLNPEFEFRLHDASDMRRLIASEFDGSFLQIFDSLGQYQQKSDLWRLCALFVSGGVYVDADYAPIGPLRDFLTPGLELAVPVCAPVIVDPMQPPVGCHTRPEAMKRLQNGLIAASPQHPVIHVALQKVRWNYFRREDQHYLAALGPALLFDAYAAVYGDPLREIARGSGEHGVLRAADLAPLVGRKHHPDVLLLLEVDRTVATIEEEPRSGIIERMFHKYEGWEEAIAILRDDNATRTSHNGKCLIGFR